MQFISGRPIYSATDLSSFTNCRHLVSLRYHKARGTVKQPFYDDPKTEALARRGIEHEKAFLASLRASGRTVAEIAKPDARDISALEAHAHATLEAMRSGVDVIYQGAFFDGTWLGYPDFLLKVATPSALGDYSYEVVDTKLARSAKAAAVLQILLYTELLGAAQGSMPERAGLALAGPHAHTEYFRFADYDAYYRSIRLRLAGVISNIPQTLAVAPDPVEHCGICAWSARCATEREAVDHLSLVAGLSRRHMSALRENGVSTLAQLGELDVPGAAPAEIAAASFERIQSQARLQLEGRRTGKNIHELLLPVSDGLGLAALPAPSEGDLYFDLEGDNNAFVHGIEYLFGNSDRNGDYEAIWALNPEEEKAAFEQLVDLIRERRRSFPDMHVYHYSAHEITALTTLMCRYGTRENDVDDLLRGEVFVDLLRVVRQGLRASVDSYSIKALEPFYGFNRRVELGVARKSLAQMELWLEFGDTDIDVQTMRALVADYNRDDCISMRAMQEWLEEIRDRLIASGTPVPRPVAGARARKEEQRREDEEIVRLRATLLTGIPLAESERTPEQHAQWLLAHMLGYYNREDKSYWFSYFDRLDMSADECEEDREALGNLEFVGMVDQPPTPTGKRRAQAARFRFPEQDHAFKPGVTAKRRRPGESNHDDPTETVGTVAAVDDLNRTIDLNLKVADYPDRIVPYEYISPKPLALSIRRMAEAFASDGMRDSAPYACAMQLLLRAGPRLQREEPLRRPDEEIVAAGRRLVRGLDRTVLPVQGPPGAGKTWLGARMILEAVRAGKRVGVTGPGHVAICNLVDELFRAADEEATTVRVVQKPSMEGKKSDRAEGAKDADAILTTLHDGAHVAAGTAWLWADEKMQSSVDILFIDEGGQFSLANALAVAPAADSMVILGDPQQLDQPRKGVHPEGCDGSALEHVLNGHDTIADDRGLFLDQTWRLHPAICEFTSGIFYTGRLDSRPGLEKQSVIADGAAASGLRLLLIPHTGNHNNSIEEAQAIAALVRRFADCDWMDRDGKQTSISTSDVIVLAPYNAQVDRIRKVDPDIRVGTVDKFQGQEAPVAIYSLAASSAADAPRGMQFLYSPNRFNVATSRGRCMAILVASPDIFAPECTTPDQMRLANAFCRFLEMAERLEIPSDPRPVPTLHEDP
jgi:predicted RecB family nuclease